MGGRGGDARGSGAAGQVRALQEVSFTVQAGEILSIVGESGSGKSTLVKIIQGLLAPDSGNVFLDGENRFPLRSQKKMRAVQTIFQDPFASLNPKLSIGTILKEAIAAGDSENSVSVSELLNSVGLPDDILDGYPHQFSGGQRQRIGIARCLALRPKLILADEPVSALDVSIQAQILNLMMALNRSGITFILIAHDLSIVKHLSTRVIIMENGKKVEENTVSEIFKNPRHVATQKLFNAIPQL